MKVLLENEIDFEKYVLFYCVFLTSNFENRAHSHAIASFFRTWDHNLLKFAFLNESIFERPRATPEDPKG